MQLNFRFCFIFLILIGDIAYSQDWRTADRNSANISPLPQNESRAIVQVFHARAFRWRKYFAVHSWISVKEKNASSYKTFEVIGFRQRQGLPVVVEKEDIPDRRWFGAEPVLIRDLRGPRAEVAIQKIQEASKSYPDSSEYRVWPGPNSNSYISYILRNTPELGVELPPTAIGRDWLNHLWPVAFSESGTGVQFSLFGLLGFTLGLGEGLEVQILGLSFGLDILRPAIKLPLLGRLGMDDAPVFGEEE